MTINFFTKFYLNFHCLFPGIEIYPFKLPEDEWIGNIDEWLQLEYHHLYQFLVKIPSKYVAPIFHDIYS